MASRQRSFFDQDQNSRRPYRPWRPNRPYHPHGQERLVEPPRSKPSIPASSRSRAKLRKFAFSEGSEQEMVSIQANASGSDKENEGSGAKADKSSQGKAQRSPTRQSSYQLKTPKTSTRQTRPPETPGISLEDLLDDSHDREPTPPRSTPKDQVGWEHTRLPSSQLGPITPSLHRGKKRPRSESPPSSARDAKADGGQGHRFPVLTATTPMRTPRYDPGPDLWNRYARNDFTTPSRPPATAKPDLLPSSPHEPFNSATRAYRRARSDLTHTARKRRRVAGGRLGSSSQVTTHVSQEEAAAARARVPNLIEKLKEVVGTQAPDGATNAGGEKLDARSSSPTPAGSEQAGGMPQTSQQLARLAMSDDDAAMEDMVLEDIDPNAASYHSQAHSQAQITGQALSQHQGSEPVDRLDPTDRAQRSFPPPIEETGRSKINTPQQQSSHGFSDFDIGDDELLSTCLQVESASVAAPSISFKETTDHTGKDVGRTTQAVSPVQLNAANSVSNGVAGNFGFDDFDEDDLAEMDLELSKYDQTTQSQPDQSKLSQGIALMEEASIQTYDITTQTHDEQHITAAYGAQENPVDLIEDDFADEDFGDAFDGLNDGQAAQAVGQENISTQSKAKVKTIQRYLVKSVHDGQYVTDRGFKRPEQVLSVQDEKTDQLKAVTLRDAWYGSPATPGSYIHVLADFNHTGQCVIDNTKGILVLHPDHLVSATVVGDSFKCMRRAVLQDRVKATNEASQPQVYGHIIHQIFQEALKENRWDDVWLGGIIREVAEKFLESLFEINVDLDTAIGELRGKMAELKSWAKRFVATQPRHDSIVSDSGAKVRLSINKLLDVEEHIWSPMYGLKGNVDATVQVRMEDEQSQRSLTVPLELKTGKNTTDVSHRAQTALYTLLMSDRYDIDVTYGILYYLTSAEMIRITGVRLELVNMIRQRNELATFIRNRLELPPMLRDKRECKRCYAQVSCFTYHKLVEGGDGESSGLKDDFMAKTQHLLPQHQEFFRKWDRLLTKEESDMMKFRRELWTMTSEERQKVGRCFSRLVIEPGSAGEMPGAQKINRYKYSFVKPSASSVFSFTESQITVGEPIVVSDEEGHYALANGYVTNIRKNRISVAVDRRLHNARTRASNFDAVSNQSFAGIMEVGARLRASQEDENISLPTSFFRLDKDEFSNGMATVRNNLIRMMEKELFGAHALRRLIVDKVAPTFLKRQVQFTLPTASKVDSNNLNVDQRAAVEKVMTAKDYALVLGMPGTGKTTTIAHIIRALVAQGKSVLLTSYTHTAVDNILLKIKDDRISVLRIGAMAKVHPEVAEFADLAAIPKTNVDDLKKSYGSKVVATTCLGINHPIFNQRIFDYCIVDEASQITLPVCLGPIRMAKTFILVGDHYQLPPLVQNKEALEGGLDVSLFKYLSDAHPDSVVTLEHQYRMCAEIMSLSNKLIYEGRLKCGNDAVASRRLVTPSFNNLASHHHHSSATLPSSQTSFCPTPKPGICWLHDALLPSSPVIFLNTDPLGDIAREQARGSRIVNEVEVKLTTQLVTALLSTGVAAQEIGVITLYRSQLALMRHELRARSTTAGAATSSSLGSSNRATAAAAEVEMHTADKYQGRDKEAIVLSLVRSNEASNVGDLLKDWRRVNVALTRARTKLVIVGSWSTMEAGNELLGNMCKFVRSRGWKYDLKKGACQDHLFDDFLTQQHHYHHHHHQYDQKQEFATDLTEAMGAGKMEGRATTAVSPAAMSAKMGKENITPLGVKTTGTPSLREPEKRGRLDPRKLLGRRPVMRNIVNEALSGVERELIEGMPFETAR